MVSVKMVNLAKLPLTWYCYVALAFESARGELLCPFESVKTFQ